jgi:hypothetical protein
MKTQNFKNHARFVPMYHFVLLTAVLALLIGSVVNFCHSAPDNKYSASLLILVSVVVLFTALFSRAFALKAQDRAINSEENFRYYVLTGKTMDARITIPQKIALRFAPDEEFVDLAHRATNENLSPKEIKKAIKNWKGDYYRA